MKKLLLLFLTLIMSVSMAFAAGSQDDAAGQSEGTVLEIAVFEGGYGRAYWDAVATAFEEKNPGVTVNVTANPEIGDIIRPNILAGNPPDFIYMSTSNNSGVAQALIKDRALVDITDVIDGLRERILPGFLDNSLCQPYGDGKVYLAPMYYSAMGLWYNKNFFESNGLTAPVTWDDFFALGEKAKQLDRSLYTYQGIYPSYNESLIYPAIAAATGLEGFTDCANYEAGAWTDPAIRRVLDNIARIGIDEYLMEGTVALDHTQAQSEWLLGNALLHPNGAWVEGEMADAPREDGFEFGFCAPPVLDANEDKYVFSTFEEIYIPAAARNVELAKKFLAFQYSYEAIELNAKLAKGVPPVVGAAEFLKGTVSPATYESYQIFTKGYQPLLGQPFGVVAETSLVPRDEFFNQLGDIMTGKRSVDQWIAHTEEVSEQVKDHLVK
ncbi:MULTISPECIES: carbohydrate ABC transporter substrate-binding protein [unclassified Oceanispirochaeta]|uniref:carbohydrate ABC transporter substrate-binding protein n=1 Tax=unclassified Oceanispirochaeta TaxID=2635722 RepID=UPI000E09C5EF|nr:MULTISPECIES: carbohydrate ABC transporter substrate-binding protein [unclassified Oceanispirochaeta]MBF9017004.1 carbohydrate ABC transporter substrate-binding protein [Oceanispirochaeta sp. M2]NPD73367.1 carbohydrate ABC transporter substrate-binding protein [Oceanispirochaeta sp. M1]RDG31024.1 carbohydrate ABC transporter substrate-binding protein [Oceanispirochaeta sp. M1]